jgi:hypothetical protein
VVGDLSPLVIPQSPKYESDSKMRSVGDTSPIVGTSLSLSLSDSELNLY